MSYCIDKDPYCQWELHFSIKVVTSSDNDICNIHMEMRTSHTNHTFTPQFAQIYGCLCGTNY